MGRYIKVNISTEGGAVVGQQAYSNIAIVGRALGSNFTLGEAYQINSPREAKALFGETSALYKSILLLFENGASSVLAIPADVTAQTSFNGVGDNIQTDFNISDIPAQPLDSVLVNSVPLTEDVDFTVDYGNGIVKFVVPPASSVPIVIGYSKHISAQITTALTKLEEYIDIQLVVGAMIFDSTLLTLIKDHCTAMESIGARMFIAMLKNGETAVTLASTLAGYRNVLIAHRSLKDVACALCGRIAGVLPQQSLALRDLRGLDQLNAFTPTQQLAFDNANIIFTHDPPKDNRNAWVVSSPFTLDTTGNLGTIDRVRVLYHLAGVLEYGLNSTNVIGQMRMNLNGLEELNSYIESLLQPWVNVGEINSFTIDNPAYILFVKTNPTPSDIQAKAQLQQNPRLEGAYALLIGFNYSGAIVFIELTVALVAQ